MTATSHLTGKTVNRFCHIHQSTDDLVTLPSDADFRSPDAGKWLKTYFRGKKGISTENRRRILRLIENICFGTAAVGYLTESMRGAGFPQAQRIMISRQVNMKENSQWPKNCPASVIDALAMNSGKIPRSFTESFTGSFTESFTGSFTESFTGSFTGQF